MYDNEPMRKVPLVVGFLAVAAALIFELQPLRKVHAQSGCSVSNLNGGFGYYLNGFTYDSQGYQVDLTASGRFVTDGAGNLTGGDTLSNDGSIVRRTYTGTYTVNADCTGNATVTFPSNGHSNFDIVVVNNGKEANMMETDTGVIFSGVAKQQFPTP